MKKRVAALLSLISCQALGCSPTADPIGEASAHYLVDFPQSAGLEGTCNETAQAAIAVDQDHTADLPLPQSDLLPSRFGELVADGGENNIECTVRQDGSGYRITAEIEGPNVSPTAGNARGKTNLRISNAYIGENGTGTARVVLRTTLTGQLTPKEDYVCQLRAIPDTKNLGSYQVRSGEARFTFLCPNAESSLLKDFSTCETRGTVWIDNCIED